MSAYREASPPAGKVHCPRCNRPLPPLDVATCDASCGTWVSAEVATIALVADELAEDRLTKWWRIRAACPVCTEPMTLRGLGEGLFQGCTKHGYFVDAEVVRHTGLGRVGVADEVERYRASIEQARVDELRRAAEREAEARARAEQQRLAEEQRQAREAARLAEQERRAAEQRAAQEKRAAEKRAREEREALKRQAREQQKAAAKRAAEERRRVEREQRRTALLARVNEAIARGTADVLVEELMRLDDRVAVLERKLVNVIVAD